MHYDWPRWGGVSGRSIMNSQEGGLVNASALDRMGLG